MYLYKLAILTIFCCFILSSCSKVLIEDLEEKENIYYERDNQNPYDGIAFSYYPNDELQSKTSFIMGKKEGLHTEYFPNGQIKLQGSYGNNFKQGIWEEFFDNGVLKLKETYINNKKNGSHQSYDEFGKLTSRSNYKDDQMHGIFELFENGIYVQHGKKIGGQYDGLITYYIEGRKSEEVTYKLGKKHGKYIKYTDKPCKIRFKGQTRLKGLSTDRYEECPLYLFNYEEDRTHGPFLFVNNVVGTNYFYQVGNIKNEEFDGPLITYRRDGSVKEKVNYKEGKKNGNHEIFDEYDDKVFIKKSTSYKDDLRHGLYFENCKCNRVDKWCLENENKFEQTGYYKDGLKDGEFIKMNCRKKERPQIKLETYKNGRRHGKVLTSVGSGFLVGQGVSNYNSKKILISSTAIGRVNKVLENYKDGLREGEFVQYYNNGKPFLTAVFKNGIENGPFKLYKPNGDLLVERNCVNRKLDSVVDSRRILGEINEGSPMPFGEFCEFYWKDELRKLANYRVLQ
tara:strand:+ start:198 stop:1730 length:1533 start_codon:yes stop_codon:yes gene_type:complete